MRLNKLNNNGRASIVADSFFLQKLIYTIHGGLLLQFKHVCNKIKKNSVYKVKKAFIDCFSDMIVWGINKIARIYVTQCLTSMLKINKSLKVIS